MSGKAVTVLACPAVEPAAPSLERAGQDRLAEAAAESFQFIWRCLRRLGVKPEAAVDDAIQQVFEIAARKREQIWPGHERAFLFKVALLVATEWRRNQRRGEVSIEDAGQAIPESVPNVEELLDQRRRRALLDAVLDGMSLKLRTVLVLYELEERSTAEIAELLGLPAGTVASRLRRARAQFQARAERLNARLSTERGEP